MQLENRQLYESFKSKCSGKQLGTVNGDELITMVTSSTRTFGQLLGRVYANFPDYTLHDEAHAVRVVHLMGRILGDNLLEKINPFEAALLILAAYAHDIGMAVSRERREEIERSVAFEEFRMRCGNEWSNELIGEELDPALVEHQRSQLFQDYLRNTHAQESARLLRAEEDDSRNIIGYSQLLRVNDARLDQPVALLSESHSWPIEKVQELRDFPIAVDYNCDMVFLACVLRIADYLDLDPSRAPRSLIGLLNPTNEESRREWRKHQATQFSVNEDRIAFQAEFDEFLDEKAMRDTLRGIEQEREDCMRILGSRPENRLRLGLDQKLEYEIDSLGYVYKEFRFQLEYKQIITLLMGTSLYRDERVFIRELIQNALDACRHTEAASAKKRGFGYQGRIVLRHFVDGAGREVIEVSDNGSGMTESIIEEFFMRVGRSFYRSFQFRRQQLGFDAISQFGIGVLSCFMKSDHIEVETRPNALVYDGVSGDGLKLEIRGPHEYFVVRPLTGVPEGTTVRVFLNTPLTGSLYDLTTRYLARTRMRVSVEEPDTPERVIQSLPFDFEDPRFRDRFVADLEPFGYAHREIKFSETIGDSIAGSVKLFLLESEGRSHLRLRDAGQYSAIGFDSKGQTMVNMSRISETIASTLLSKLQELRGVAVNLDGQSQEDVEAIARDADRVLQMLIHHHDTSEVMARWKAARAAYDAMIKSTNFASSPMADLISRLSLEIFQEINSFVTGEIVRTGPCGIISQDGIDLTEIVDLSESLEPHVGYLYNIDLAGEDRLTLNAARDDYLRDSKYRALIDLLHNRIGEELGRWFMEIDLPETEIQRFLRSAPASLGRALRRVTVELQAITHNV